MFVSISNMEPKDYSSKPIEGGKFCADCGGRCCRGCAGATGYFYQKLHVTDFQRFTLVELQAIHEMRTFENGGRYIDPADKKHPAHKLAALLGVEFHPKHGFGGPTGCRLPRNKRSRTCVKYFCSELAKHVGIDPHLNWSEATKEEIAMNVQVMGEPYHWETPITEYIEKMKGKELTPA